MQKYLENGLILRSLSEGITSDQERLPDFYAAVNTEGEPEYFKEGLRHWVRDLMFKHPTTTHDDIFVVVDPDKDDLIASATLLIPQRWRYEDIDISVGRPELVGTLPEYRNRRLVRALFDVVHARSAALGHQLLAITGIPHFYRQFGYTMTVELGTHAVYQLAALPDRAPDDVPTYTLRQATENDIPDISRWSDYFARERVLTEHHTPETLRYDITGRHRNYYPHTEYLVIATSAGQGVGFLTLLTSQDEPYRIRCVAYVVGEDTSYLATFNDVMHGIKAWAIANYTYCPAMLVFSSGLHEALDQLVDSSPGGLVKRNQDYAWYLRVPKAIDFLNHIAPVLERRLHGSGAHRYTGVLRVGFYDQTGIAIVFEVGRITAIDAITGKNGYDVQFLWHLFWNVVFGQHSVGELGHLLAEVYTNARAAVLLAALFPKKAAWLHGFS